MRELEKIGLQRAYPPDPFALQNPKIVSAKFLDFYALKPLLPDTAYKKTNHF